MTNSRWLAAASAVAALAACSCSSRQIELRTALVPSRAAEMAAAHGLIDVRTFAPDIAVDLRYATPFNVARRPLYPPDMPCLLRTGTAVKLKKAQALLRAKGCGLRIWDAWRPPEVQLILVAEEGNTGLFMDPKSSWSRHCSGAAVDVTLIDSRGVEQEMPTYHDEGGPAASYQYTGHSAKVRRNLHLLQGAMFDAGFQLLDTEWWHFDDAGHYLSPPPVVFGSAVGIHVSRPE
ncbi:MAG: hypothetical protein K1X78_00965 [Verrucomicrobiaceae bacterium]|nr:hypothetical protein [Verrucomicrobiaceae bacterium]